jgi:hypothetical protein
MLVKHEGVNSLNHVSAYILSTSIGMGILKISEFWGTAMEQDIRERGCVKLKPGIANGC